MLAPNTSILAAPGTGCPSQEGLDRTGSAGIPAVLESQHTLWCRRWISQALKVASFRHFKPLSTSTASRHHLTQHTAEIIAWAGGLTIPTHVRGDEIPSPPPTRSGALGYAPEMGNSQFTSPNFHWRHPTFPSPITSAIPLLPFSGRAKPTLAAGS